jgi:hypothetical protein
MIQGPCTLVSALRDFFLDEKKIEISEFKALSYEDKVELREMLIAEGYDVQPVVVSSPQGQ